MGCKHKSQKASNFVLFVCFFELKILIYISVQMCEVEKITQVLQKSMKTNFLFIRMAKTGSVSSRDAIGILFRSNS